MYMVCFEHAIQMFLILFLMSRFVPWIPCMVFTCIDECVHMCVSQRAHVWYSLVWTFFETCIRRTTEHEWFHAQGWSKCLLHNPAASCLGNHHKELGFAPRSLAIVRSRWLMEVSSVSGKWWGMMKLFERYWIKSRKGNMPCSLAGHVRYRVKFGFTVLRLLPFRHPNLGGRIFNLSNTIMGGGILGLPHAMAQMGLVAGIALLILTAGLCCITAPQLPYVKFVMAVGQHCLRVHFGESYVHNTRHTHDHKRIELQRSYMCPKNMLQGRVTKRQVRPCRDTRMKIHAAS